MALQLKEALWLEETQRILCGFVLHCPPEMMAIVQSGLLYKNEHQATSGFIVYCSKESMTLLPQGGKGLLLICNIL